MYYTTYVNKLLCLFMVLCNLLILIGESLKTTKESLENGSQIKLDASRYKIKYAVLSIASNMYREFSKTLHMI